MRASDITRQDFVIRAFSLADIRRALEENHVVLISAIELLRMIENELDRPNIFYGLSVRTLGVIYSESNSLGTRLNDGPGGGLTAFGEGTVQRMNKLGILIDASHASDRTTLDSCEISDDPGMLIHNGAQALLDI